MSWYRCPTCHTKIDVGLDIGPRPLCACGAPPPARTIPCPEDMPWPEGGSEEQRDPLPWEVSGGEINMGGATSPLIAPAPNPENE